MKQYNTGFDTGMVMTIAASHLLHDIFSSFLSPFLPLIIDKFALTMTMAGFLTMCFHLAAVANPVLGMLTDTFGLRSLIVVAPGLTATGICLMGLAPSFEWVCVLVFITGASASLYHVLGPVLIAQSAGGRLGRGMSLWMTGGELARTIGPLVAVGLISLVGFSSLSPFLVIGVATSVWLGLSLRRLPPVEPKKFREHPLRLLWNLRGLMFPMAGVLMARALVVNVMLRFLPTYMVARGESLWYGGVSLAVLELLGTIGALVAGSVSDRLGRRTVLLISLIVAPLAMLLLVFAPAWGVFPTLMLLGFFCMASMPVILALVQDFAVDNRGAANGLFMAFNAAAGATALLFVGWLVDLLGFQHALSACALLSLVGAACSLLLPKLSPQAVQA